MIAKERIVAAVLLVYSLVYFLGSLGMDRGSLDNPGCGVFPGAIGLSLLALALVNGYRVFFRRPAGAEGQQMGFEGYRGPFALMISVFAYPLLLGILNFLPATFLILFFMLFLLRYRKFLGSTLIAGGVTLATYLIFTKVLGVVFPSGPIEHFVYSLF